MASHRAHFVGNNLRDELDRAGIGHGKPGLGDFAPVPRLSRGAPPGLPSYAYTAPVADRKGIAMPSPTITSDNLDSSNGSIAADLATILPTAPRKPVPNSAKKRRPMPDLSRSTATPGHGAKMSMIFRDAATSLQSSRLPTDQPSSNVKRPRVPLSQARSIQFGSNCQDATMGSSGLGSPTKISQNLGKSCESESPSSYLSRLQVSRVATDYPVPIPMTIPCPRIPEAPTIDCLGVVTDVGGVGLDGTLKVCSASLSSQIEECGKEPISSGFATPIVPTPISVDNPERVKYPNLENWRSLRFSSNASSLDSDIDDFHSTHGVPFILPFPYSNAQRSHIETWLNGTIEAESVVISRSPKQCLGADDPLVNESPYSQSIEPNIPSPIRPRVSPSRLKQGLSGASSDKENISPSKWSSSPRRPPARHLQTRFPTHFHLADSQPLLQHTKALHFTHPLTPQGHLTLPPKRKRVRVNWVASSRDETEIPTSSRDFTIHENQLAEALAQLSPDVERHRKGRGPKRERCMSYWDEDILHPGRHSVPMEVDINGETMMKGRQVLGESEQTVRLTTEKPFVKEAESASFRFKA